MTEVTLASKFLELPTCEVSSIVCHELLWHSVSSKVAFKLGYKCGTCCAREPVYLEPARVRVNKHKMLLFLPL